MSQDKNLDPSSLSSKNKTFEGGKKFPLKGNAFQHRGSQKLSKQHRPKKERQTKAYADDAEFNIEDELLSGNFRARGRKTQISINHLLDFQLPERPHDVHNAGSVRRRSRKNDNDFVHLHGDSFINANSKFIVDDRFSYDEQSIDPNLPLSGEKIVRVVVPRGQSCPICLTEDMVAPRMVSCGHIFCMTCMLNFFAVEDKPANAKADATTYVKKKRYKECPLCSTIIRKTDTKAVNFVEGNPKQGVPEIGKESNFQLMCRPHTSMLPLPVSLNVDPLSLGNFPPVELAELAPYCRIMKCSRDYALTLYQRDIKDIETQNEIDKALYNDNGKYAKLAIEDIQKELCESSATGEKDLSAGLSQLSLDVGLEKFDESNAFFFYETAFDATTKYYLSPLDVKILLTAFGGYSRFPPILNVKVENVHHGSVVTESLIQRYKYFGHLPIGSELAFVDIDWRNSDVLPMEVYKKFASELTSRRRKSTWKKQREDKEKTLYQKRLEQEQAEFYQRENGNVSPPTNAIIPSKPVPLQSLSHKADKEISEVAKPKSRMERTVWGTSIPIVEQSSDTDTGEDKDLEDLLQSLKQHQGGKQGKKKKKKKMVTLLSSGQSRGSF